jgi:transposase-like protein
LSLAELKNDFQDKEKINLVFDACHFKREFCLFLFRSSKRNVHYDFKDSEKIIHYEQALKEISQRHEFSSFTIDGRRGVIQLLESLFPSVPIHLCHFHQVKTILKYTTKRPKTECGRELKDLIMSLKSSSKEDFTKRYNTLKEKYKEFLKEKNEAGQYSHRRLRSAFRSIKTNLPYLFTFQDFPNIQIEKTTNSCDGYFSHLKAKVNIHRGISSRRKIQLIIQLLSQ